MLMFIQVAMVRLPLMKLIGNPLPIESDKAYCFYCAKGIKKKKLKLPYVVGNFKGEGA